MDPAEKEKEKFANAVLQYGVVTSAIVALCTGYITWSFKYMVLVYGGAVFLVMLVVVPDWDFFTKRPCSEWIEPMAADEESRKLQKVRFPLLRKTPKYAKREDIHVFGILFFLACVACSSYLAWKFVTY